MDMENVLLLNEDTYNGLQAYKNSKAANLMFTYELAKRLEGSGVTANAVCPGKMFSLSVKLLALHHFLSVWYTLMMWIKEFYMDRGRSEPE